MNTAPLLDKHDPTTTVNTQWMPIYERRLDRESKQSIPYFGGKDKPVKHMLALCSIFWQEHLRKASEKAENSLLSTYCHDMLRNAESLPKDASQPHTA